MLLFNEHTTGQPRTGQTTNTALPDITLMQPTLVAQPFHRAGWVYEEKYDGWRMVAYKARDHVRLISRPGARVYTRVF